MTILGRSSPFRPVDRRFRRGNLGVFTSGLDRSNLVVGPVAAKVYVYRRACSFRDRTQGPCTLRARAAFRGRIERLCQQSFNHFAADIREAIIAALKAVSKPGVINPQTMEHGGVEI